MTPKRKKALPKRRKFKSAKRAKATAPKRKKSTPAKRGKATASKRKKSRSAERAEATQAVLTQTAVADSYSLTVAFNGSELTISALRVNGEPLDKNHVVSAPPPPYDPLPDPQNGFFFVTWSFIAGTATATNIDITIKNNNSGKTKLVDHRDSLATGDGTWDGVDKQVKAP